MKTSRKIIFGLSIIVVFLSFANIAFASAAPIIPVEVNGDQYQVQLQANNGSTFRFRMRTQLTINCSQDLDLKMSCEALKIGVKYFEIEIDGDSDLEMNMTCTEEQAELGLLKGNTYQVRNRNRFLYQEGFCIQLECNGTFNQARLRIQANEQNQVGTWAYYDHSTSEWVGVATTLENGYLVATTDHFSTWTILIPEIDYIPAIITGVVVTVAIVAAVGVIVIYLKKRK